MRFKYLVSALMIAAAMAAGAFACSAAETPDSVVVYYFHTNFRCANCHNMENWTKELMAARFKGDVDSGRLEFRMLNTDEKANKHFMDDYKLYTKSIVLSLVKNGKETKYANLAKIWDYLRSKEKFQEYVGAQIEEYLGDLKR
jgi:pyruvate-formate lyase-activating enzyme